MNECRNCRYWRRKHGSTEVGRCALISGQGLFGAPRRAIAAEAVITREDFGCADFAEKGLDETVASLEE